MDILLNLVMFLPIRTDRPLRTVPYVTYSICFLNILIFFLTNLRLSGADLYLLHKHYGFITANPSFSDLFTHAFLHGDFGHLLGNLLLLWIIGTVLEAGIGSLLFSLLYLASLVSATMLYAIIGRIFMPDTIDISLVGASGAISGIAGFAAFRYYHTRVMTVAMLCSLLPVYVFRFPLWAYAAYQAFKDLVSGIGQVVTGGDDMVAHWAHIGGLGLGVLAALMLRSFQEGQRENVLEDSVKNASAGAPTYKSVQDVWALLKNNPNDPELLEALGNLTLLEGNADYSRQCYLRAIPLFISNSLPDRAAICYLNVTKSFPDTVLPPREQMNVATTLERMNHPHEAMSALLLISNTYPGTNEAETALLRAAQIAHRHFRDPNTTARLLRTLLEQYPFSPWADMAKDMLRKLANSPTR